MKKKLLVFVWGVCHFGNVPTPTRFPFNKVRAFSIVEYYFTWLFAELVAPITAVVVQASATTAFRMR